MNPQPSDEVTVALANVSVWLTPTSLSPRYHIRSSQHPREKCHTFSIPSPSSPTRQYSDRNVSGRSIRRRRTYPPPDETETRGSEKLRAHSTSKNPMEERLGKNKTPGKRLSRNVHYAMKATNHKPRFKVVPRNSTASSHSFPPLLRSELHPNNNHYQRLKKPLLSKNRHRLSRPGTLHPLHSLKRNLRPIIHPDFLETGLTLEHA